MWNPGAQLSLNSNEASAVEILREESTIVFIPSLEQDLGGRSFYNEFDDSDLPAYLMFLLQSTVKSF